MRKILDRSFMYATINTLVIAVFATIASIGASNAVFVSEIDLRFIGPVAIFLMFLSLALTYLPMTILRALTIKKFLHIKKAPYIAFVVELLFFVFSLLGYMSAMSGDNLGGIALLLITVMNIVFAIGFGITYGIIQLFNKSRPKITEWRTMAIHESSQPTIVQSTLKN